MSEAVNAKPDRPVYRNIGPTTIVFKYRLPAAGIVSILHRISGLLLFLALPFLFYLFEQSLVSVETFETFRRVASHTWVKLALLVLIWAYLHHFTAGIRHLLMDLHIGLEMKSGSLTARTVLAVSLGLTVLLALKLFGVY